MLSTAIAEGTIICDNMYAKLLLTSYDVQVVSCAPVDPAVVDVLTADDVPGVASGPDVAAANTTDDVTCSTVLLSFLASLLL